MTAVITIRTIARKNRRAVLLLAVGLVLLLAVLVGKVVESKSGRSTALTPPASSPASQTAPTVSPATIPVAPGGPAPNYQRNPFAVAK